MDEGKQKFRKDAFQGLSSDYGMKIQIIEPGCSKGTMEIEERMLNPYGAIHGGVLFALADTVGGAAALSRGFYVVTSNGTMNYLHGTHDSRKITAIAEEVKHGRTLSIYDVKITDEHDILVATAMMTYFSTGASVSVENLEDLKY